MNCRLGGGLTIVYCGAGFALIAFGISFVFQKIFFLICERHTIILQCNKLTSAKRLCRKLLVGEITLEQYFSKNTRIIFATAVFSYGGLFLICSLQTGNDTRG